MLTLLRWPQDFADPSRVGSDPALAAFFRDAANNFAQVRVGPSESFFFLERGNRRVEYVLRGLTRNVGEAPFDKLKCLWETLPSEGPLTCRLGSLFGLSDTACVVVCGADDIRTFTTRWLDGLPLSEAVRDIRFWDRGQMSLPLTMLPSPELESRDNLDDELERHGAVLRATIDPDAIRILFQELLGESKYRKFVALTPNDPSKGKLRYWQEEMVTQFNQAHPELALNYFEICRIFRICELHGCDLVQKKIPVVHGCVDYAPEFWEQRNKFYPNAPMPFYSTEGGAVNEQKVAIWYCPECDRIDCERNG